MRRGTVTALAIALALAGGAYLAGRLVPPRFSPLAPLDVRDEPVPLATAMKLARARTDLAYCRAGARDIGPPGDRGAADVVAARL
jgi:hypothetical protein